jgi:hypothetical protein
LKVGNSGGVHLGNEEGGVIFVEVQGVILDGDGESPSQREMEDREEVGPEVWDIEDIREQHLWPDLAINNRLKENSALALGVDG